MENQHGGAFFFGQLLSARFSVRDGDGHQPYSQGFYTQKPYSWKECRCLIERLGCAWDKIWSKLTIFGRNFQDSHLAISFEDELLQSQSFAGSEFSIVQPVHLNFIEGWDLLLWCLWRTWRIRGRGKFCLSRFGWQKLIDLLRLNEPNGSAFDFWAISKGPLA